MTVRPTYAQMERMIEYMEDNLRLALVQPCQIGLCGNKHKWEELARILNSMEGLRKDKKRWARFWVECKNRIKRRLIHWDNTILLRAEAGLQNEPAPLSDLESRILQFVNKKPDDKKKTLRRKCKCESASKPKSRSIGTQTGPEEVASSPPDVRRSTRIRTRSQSEREDLGRQRILNVKLQRAAAAVEQARVYVLRKNRTYKTAQPL